jgi:hypothetical protein
VAEIDRRVCRQHVEQHFSVQSMVDGYEAVYRDVLFVTPSGVLNS